MSRKNDPDFTQFILENAKLDANTGNIDIQNIYANLCLNFGWKGKLIVVPYSHIVWLLTHKRWPQQGFHIDHINNVALDNRPVNLAELTEQENQRKRRGRIVYRNYGRTKYGYGVHLYRDKRDNRYYVTRQLSRGHGDGDLKSIKRGFGGFDTEAEAEKKIAWIVTQIKDFGEDWMPEAKGPGGAKSKATKQFDALQSTMIEMRKSGMTFQAIADHFGLAMGVVYRRTKDI